MTAIGAFSSSGVLTLARGRNGDIYGVNGLQRGFRWNGTDASVEQLGISPPAAPPTVSATTGTPRYFVQAIDVINSGKGYVKEPAIRVANSSGTADGPGAAKAKAEIEGGALSQVLIQDRGSGYSSEPDVSVDPPDGASPGNVTAVLRAVLRPGLRGKYWCAYRYVDDTPESAGGPIASSLSPHAEIELSSPVGQLNWSNLSAGTEPRASKIELWRTTADQARVFYRVAVLPASTTIYTDTLSDTDLSAPSGLLNCTAVRPCTSVLACTASAATDVFSCTSHGLSNGDEVRFTSLTGGEGLVLGLSYYVISATAHAFRVSLAPGGTSVNITTDLTDGTACKKTASIDVVSCTNHGMSDGDEVRFTSLAGGEGLSTGIPYYVIDATTTTFRVSATRGGSAVSITTDLTAGVARGGGFRAMPATLPNGQPNANRFGLPPQNKSVIVMFQDRAWYGVDAPGRTYNGDTDSNHSEPNTLYFSEVDEPESVPQVNELILQDNVNGADKITALMPFGGAMVVFQERHCYRLSYAAQPVIDANFTLIAQRGCINQRCWAAHDGVAYVADTMGIYVMDGGSVTPISDGIDTYWTQGVINFTSSDRFFMSVDPMTRVVRFHFSVSSGLPDRALCYHPLTKAWWEEQYAQSFGAAAIVRSGRRQRLVWGAANGALLLADSGGQDVAASSSASIACTLRTSNFSLAPTGQDRSVSVLYKPTSVDCTLFMKMHYNNSATARPAAIASNPGAGVTTDAGGHAAINIALGRTDLGPATGYATAMYAGRVDERSAGGDRHVAVGLDVTRPADESVTVYGMAVRGAGQ